MTFLPKKTIVVPFDFSEYSVAAVDTALEIADGDSQLHVIHVLPELHAADRILNCRHQIGILREYIPTVGGKDSIQFAEAAVIGRFLQ